MTKQKTTKHALLLSGLSLLMCISMLIGSTFAWFTDSVTSSKNKIIAGNLDIEVYYAHSSDVVDGKIPESNWKLMESDKSVFNPDALWEPGYTELVYFKIKNVGSLAAKYEFQVDILDETPGTNVDGDEFRLSDHIQAYVNACTNRNLFESHCVYSTRDLATNPPGAPAPFYDSLSNAADGTVSDAVNSLKLNHSLTLKPANEWDSELYATLCLWMPTTVGNAVNHKTGTQAPQIDLGIRVVATQNTYEKDSFDNQYDKDAKYPLGKSALATDTENGIKSVVAIPAEAPAGKYTLDVTNLTFDNNAGQTSMLFDMALLCDSKKVAATDLEYQVTVQLSHPFLEISDVKHNGVSVGAFTYDPVALTVSFTTTNFSPFAIEYKDYTDPSFALEYETLDANAAQFKITKGVFVGKNPADLDPSLKAADSEYIAINYEKAGQTQYVIAKRATTVIAAADNADSYTATNGNYTVTTTQSGKLWSLISGLQSNEHNTVFLLPGTYNEATTIGVYSSMDIIGLGDKDSVKIIKLSSSSSNRHLFNCSGTKADYIQVTLRNLYLDATANTTNNKDNAAVQSIRKTKVKCYDLTIVKSPTNWAAVAFYVNGNNAVDGVKYPAYLYAENCALNTTRTFGIVSTSGSYKFYHSGLTYNGTAYTNNSGSIKNQTMLPNDWEW